MENKRAHLEMIQGVVNRMANNSFHLKGWSVALVSALFALGAHQSDIRFVALAYFPALAFWVLDGYFLNQEKLFRALYDHVRKQEEAEVVFSMDTSQFTDKVDNWARSMFRSTLLIFYGTVFVASIVVAMLIES